LTDTVDKVFFHPQDETIDHDIRFGSNIDSTAQYA